jgi:hypothetical protein
MGLNLSACCCCGIAGVAGCSPPASTTTVFVTGIRDALSNDALPQLQSAFLRANFQTKQRALRSRRESRRRRRSSSWPTTLILSTRSKISLSILPFAPATPFLPFYFAYRFFCFYIYLDFAFLFCDLAYCN